VYLNVGKTAIAALALSTGTEQWRQTLEGTLSAPVAAKGGLFVGSDANAFYALDPASQQKDKREWTWGAQFIGGDVVGAAVDGNQVFFVSLDNLVRAVDRRTGNQHWQKSIPTRPVAPPIAFGGAVFITGVSPAIAAFDAKSGAALGTYVAPTATGLASAPILQGPPLIDPVLRPFRVAAAVITADGRAIGLRPTAMMFREPPVIPLAVLPGRPLTREVSPAALPRPAASRLP
jgi:outer membrane protein assembly factor BamB